MLSKLFYHLFPLFLLFYIPQTGYSIIRYVTSTADTYSAGELRYEVDLSNAGDTVLIDVAGIVTLNSSVNINNSITIIGPSAKHFTIEASVAGTAFNIAGGTVEIEGVKIVNSTNSSIFINSGNVRLSKCVFVTNNSGLSGGVIRNAGNVKVEYCSFMSNSSSQGGAIENNGGMMDFYNCTFFNNQSTGHGGAIYNKGGGILTLVNNTFHTNTATASGGAVQAFDGNVTVQNNIFNGNSQGSGSVLNSSSATYTSIGGNVFSEISVPVVIQSQATDLANVNPQLEPTMITDGFGLEYFSLQPGSPCIDFGNNSGVTTFDARQVWRVMDGTGSFAQVDAGAVEYSPFTVKTLTGAGSFQNTIIALGSITYFGKKAIVFEHPGLGPHTTNLAATSSISESNVIINGFSQNGSVIPGPLNNVGNLTAGYTSVEFIGGGSGDTFLYVSSVADSVVIVGLSIMNYGVAGISSMGRGTVIEGCHIGVNAYGSSSGSNSIGIEIPNGGAGEALIGVGKYILSNPMAARNVISGNQIEQININNCFNNRIEGNFIGLSSDGVTMPSPQISGAIGINIVGGPNGFNNIIGGAEYGQGNVVAGQLIGINTSASNTFITDNFIGSDFNGFPPGNLPAFSNDRGIVVDGVSGVTSNNLIKGNIIGNTTVAGINLTNGSSQTLITNNFIGLALNGITSVSNSGDGILVDYNSSMNVIGGLNSTDGNNICNSSLAGIAYSNMTAPCYDSIMGNYIGLDVTLAMQGNGVGIHLGSNTSEIFIGDTLTGKGNLIAANNGAGIETDPLNGVSNIRISGNRMYYNTGLGIDLDANGPSITLGTAPISNNAQIPPNLLKLFTCPGNNFSTVTFTVDFPVNFTYQIEFFKANIDAEEGDTFLGSMSVFPTTQPQTFYYNIPAPALTLGDIIVATATQINSTQYNTSEFSDTLLFSASTITVNAGPDTTICPGDVAFMNATATGGSGLETYLWSTGVASATMSMVPAFTTTYFVDVTDGGCVVSDTITVFHYSSPLPSVMGSDSVCVGGVSTYSTSTSFVNYSWAIISGVGSTNTGSSTFSETVTFGTMAGNDTLLANVQDVNGCWWFGKLPINVFAPPVTGGITSTATSVCVNQTGVVYTVPFTSGSTYAWTTPGGTIVTGNGTNSIIVDWGAISGTYTISVVETNVTGCSGSPVTYIVSVNPIPDAFGQTPSFCSDNPGGNVSTVNLAADLDNSVNGGSGNVVTWYNDAGLTMQISNPTIYSAVDGATVYASVSNGVCAATAVVTITVVPSPVVSAGADAIICEGSTITLSGSAVGSVSNQWITSGDGSFSNPSDLNAIYTPGVNDVATGTATLTLVSNGNSPCTSISAFMVVTITPLPTISVSSTNLLCSNTQDGTITINVVSGTGPFLFSADNGATTVSGASTYTFSNLSTGAYIPFVSDMNGCAISNPAVSLTAPSPVVASVVVTNISCFGSADGQFDVSMSGGTGPYMLSTDGGSTFNVPSANPEIIAASVGNFAINVVVVDGNNCSSDTNVYTVLEPAQISYTVLTTPDTCSQGIGTIVVNNVTGGTGGPYGYSIDGGTTIQLFNTFNVFAGSYNVIVADANGCVKITPFIVIGDSAGTLTNAGTKGPYVVCTGESKYITAYGGTSYNWLTPGIIDPFSDSTQVTPDSTTIYVVEISSGGCSKIDSTQVTVDANGCEQELISNNVFSPDGDGVNDFFIFDIQKLLDNKNRVYIYNRWGDLIREFTDYNNVDVVWDGNSEDGPVPSGTYFYLVEIPAINYSNSGWIQVVR